MLFEIMAQQQSGGGQGSDGINNALNNLTDQLQTIGGAIAGVAFVAAVIVGIVTVIRGGNLQRLVGPVGFVLGGSFLLGIGVVAVGWFMGLGNAVAG